MTKNRSDGVQTVKDDADRERSSRGSSVAFYLVLTAIVFFAALLRVRYADADPTYDELWHLALSLGRGTPFGQFPVDQLVEAPASQIATANGAAWWHVWTNMSLVLHPPLYCQTLRWWRDLFGDSLAVARAYSNVWSIVGLIFTALVARMTMGPLIAALVALAIAVSSTQVYLGQEVRGYAMLFGLSAIGLWGVTRVELLGPTRRRAICLGLLPLPMLLTHYFAFGAALAIGIFGVWKFGGHRRAFLTACAIGAVVYCVTWIPFAVRQLDAVWTGDAFLHARRDLLVEGVLLATSPYRLIADRRFADVPLSAAAIVLFVMPWLLARRLPALRSWGLWLACCIGTLVALDLTRSTIHLGYARYLTAATPAVFLLAAGCGHAVSRWAGVVVAALLVVLAGTNLLRGTWTDGDIGLPIDVIHAMGRDAEPGDAMIVCQRGDFPFFADILLLHCSAEPGILPRPTVQLTRPMSPELARRLPRRAWLLSSRTNGPVDQIVPGARTLSSQSADGDLTLTRLELPAADATTASPATTPAGIR